MSTNINRAPLVTPTTLGDLYAVGFDPVADFERHAKAILAQEEGQNCRLVHALIAPGELLDPRTPYAWLEMDLVYGDGIQFRVAQILGKKRELNMPAKLFRQLTRVVEAPGYVASFTREEVAAKVFALKKYGPWDLNLDGKG